MEPLMAAAGHGPGRHGTIVNVILVVLVAIAVVAGVVLVIRSRKRSPERSDRDQGREA